MVTNEPSLPPLADPKGKRARSPSLVEGAGKVKKSKESSLSLGLNWSSSKALIMETMAEVRASLNIRIATSISVSKALKGREEGLAAIGET